MSRFYITTAIDYANGAPHLGHAFEKIGADAIARYRRLRGDDVHFLMGMDEHGQKVAQSAAARGVTPQAFTDEISALFERAWRRLGISNDQWIRTTADAHKAGVRALIKRIHDNTPDDFYERTYEGWYCVGCELFKREGEIVDGKCVLHPTRTLEWTREQNWFFRLSRYTGFLQRLFAERPTFLEPETRRNEILALLEQGLEDISITRSRLAWAIPFPLQSSGGEQQGTWVWFDALPNYLTATGFPAKGYRGRWPAQLHVIGKDITRLHCVVWPAMLQAAELPLPERVYAHGFVSLGGERFSKSAGVTLDLDEAIDRFGADAFRYYLLRDVPFDGDGSFSWERFEAVYTAELANGFGNLASRTVAMIEKYCGATVPAAPPQPEDAQALDRLRDYEEAMAAFRLHDALRSLHQTVVLGNEFITQRAPWKLAKDPAARPELETVLAVLARLLGRQAVALHPFMPEKSEALWRQLGGPGNLSDQRWGGLGELSAEGWRVKKGDGLFPKTA